MPRVDSKRLQRDDRQTIAPLYKRADHHAAKYEATIRQRTQTRHHQRRHANAKKAQGE